MKIDHVRLLVVNFTECFRFYRDIIGLRVVWGNETDSYAAFAVKDSDVPNVALFDRHAMAEALGTSHLPLDATSQDKSMLIIGVDNVDSTVTRMQALGVHFVLGPRDFSDWGMRSAYLRDPDGNLLELTCDLPPENWSPELRTAAKQFGQG